MFSRFLAFHLRLLNIHGHRLENLQEVTQIERWLQSSEVEVNVSPLSCTTSTRKINSSTEFRSPRGHLHTGDVEPENVCGQAVYDQKLNPASSSYDWILPERHPKLTARKSLLDPIQVMAFALCRPQIFAYVFPG